MPELNDSDDYELLPHKEVEELKEELQKLKSFDVQPTKKLNVSVVELNGKIDKLIHIFEEANKQVAVEEGGLTFHDKMKPLVERMSKILQQNAEIAEGIVALADIVKDLRHDLEQVGIVGRSSLPPLPSVQGSVPRPPPPLPPRRG